MATRARRPIGGPGPRRATGTAALTLTGERLAWPGRFAGGQLLLALDAAQSQGRLTLLPAQAAELTLPEIDADFLAGLGLPADLRARLAGGRQPAPLPPCRRAHRC